MAAERPKFVKEMPVSRAELVKNERRNYGNPLFPVFLMVGHDCNSHLHSKCNEDTKQNQFESFSIPTRDAMDFELELGIGLLMLKPQFVMRVLVYAFVRRMANCEC